MMITKIRQISILILLLITITSCEQESCLYCNTYDIFEFNGDIENYNDSLFVCEQDDMWDEIVWNIEDYINAQTINDKGGDFSYVDLDIYTVGYRSVENTDLDNDGIINEYDNDIDNDGIINEYDTTPYGVNDLNIVELLICTDNK
tara:strand:+ start:50 stop:487 length:438 start_codon:yes stop_codon:yes gene_type:complete